MAPLAAGEGDAPGPYIETVEDLSSYETFRTELLARDLTGDGEAEMIGIVSIRMKEGFGPPQPYTYVDVFQRAEGRYTLIHRIGMEAFKSAKFTDVNQDGVDELIVEGVFGAHGHFLNVVRFDAPAAAKAVVRPIDLWSEINAHGVSFECCQPLGAVIKSGVPPAGDDWSYADPHPFLRFVWSGDAFVFDRIVPE